MYRLQLAIMKDLCELRKIMKTNVTTAVPVIPNDSALKRQLPSELVFIAL